MLDLCSHRHPGSEVPRDEPSEHLHHHPEEASGERGVPSALGRLVPDESVLRLDLDELGSGCQRDVRGRAETKYKREVERDRRTEGGGMHMRRDGGTGGGEDGETKGWRDGETEA